MRISNERIALLAIFIAGLVLRLLMIYPFGHLLGEDTYFHRDLVRFLLDGGGVAQFNVEDWGTLHPYFLSLSAKLQSYPYGFHLILYPIAKVFGESSFRYAPSLLTSFIPVAIYLFMKEFSGRGDIALAAAVFYTVPNVIAFSVLLLPQSLGMLMLPLALWLYLRTEYGGVVGALFSFVHPFSCVVIMVAMFTLSLYRHEYRKFAKVFTLSAIVISIYVAITLTMSDPGSTFSMTSPRFVFYGVQRYVSAFSVALLFPIGLLFMRERREWYLVVGALLFAFASFFQISNLPPERTFNFLAFFLACIAAYMVRGFCSREGKAVFMGALIVVSMTACTDIFGQIGPAYVEIASWEFINEQTMDDVVVWGWDRYPQIYTTERSIILSPHEDMDYICPESHTLGKAIIEQYMHSDWVGVIYDNYVPVMVTYDR